MRTSEPRGLLSRKPHPGRLALAPVADAGDCHLYHVDIWTILAGVEELGTAGRVSKTSSPAPKCMRWLP